MKITKLTYLIAVSLFCTTTFVFSQGHSGGFQGPTAAVTSTAEIKNYSWAQDDKPVILEGYVVSALGDDKYLFQDVKGKVVVDIDSENWMGVHATPKTKLRLYGKVDKDTISDASVEVDRVEIIN